MPLDARRLLRWHFPNILILLLAGRLAAGAAQAPTAPPGIPPSETTRPELVMQTGHSGSIKSVAFSVDSRWLASAGGDNIVKIWEVATGREVRTLFTGDVWDVAFSPDGRFLASGSMDNTVKLWEVGTGRLVRMMTGHSRLVTTVAFSPDGRLLASGSWDDTVKVWEVDSGCLVRTLAGHKDSVHAVAFTPDGRSLASSSLDKTVKFWEVRTGRLLRTVPIDFNSFGGIALSPDCGWLAAGHSGPGHKDHRLMLWDLAEEGAPRSLTGQTDHVDAIALGPDGHWLVWAGGRTIKILDLASGRETRSIPTAWGVGGIAVSPDGRWLGLLGGLGGGAYILDAASGQLVHALSCHAYPVAGVAFSPDKRWLILQTVPFVAGEDRGTLDPRASGEGRGTLNLPMVFETATGEMIWRAAKPSKPDSSSPNPLTFIDSVSPDGRQSAEFVHKAPWGHEIEIQNLDTGRKLPLLAGHKGRVLTAVFSRDGRWLASSGEDLTIKLWDVSTGREVYSLTGNLKPVTALVFSPDGRWLASGGFQRTPPPVADPSLPGQTGRRVEPEKNESPIRLWDVATGREAGRLALSDLELLPLAFSPDSSMLAVSRTDNFSSAVVVCEVPAMRRLTDLAVWGGPVTSLAFTPDGKRLATNGKMVTFWDVQTGRQSRTLDGQAGSLAFSPDGLRLATWGNGKIKLRDVSTGREVYSLTANPEPSTPVAFSPDGRWLAWGGMDPTSRNDRWLAWVGVDPATAGREFRMFSGHTGYLESVAFSPDGLRLASGSYDKTIKLWETATGREIKTLTGHTGEVISLAFSPDGHLLASGSGDWTIKLWDTATGRELRTLIGEGGKVESFLSRVNSLVFSPDGRWLAAGNDDRTVRLWDVATWREARVMISDTVVSAIAFSPDGRFVASGPGLNIWEVDTGREVFTLTAHRRVSKVAFSTDGKRLATVGGSSDNEIRIWEIATGRELMSLVGPGAGLDAVEFSPDGRNLIAAALDGSARIWDALTGEELGAIAYLVEADEWLVVSPDGLFDGSPGGWKRIVWRFGGNATAVVEWFFNEYYYPGLLAEILAGRKPKAARAIANLDRRQVEIKLTLAGGLNPAGSISTRTANLKLDVAEAPADQTHQVGSGAHDVRLFRNGSLVKVWRGDVLQGKGGKVTLETTLPIITGENRFTAYAFNRDNVKSSDANLMVTGADSLKRPGAAYILAIGINEYANKDYNLNYAMADAQAFGEELQRQQTKLKNFGSVQVISLLNRDATKANILRALARLAGTDTGPLPVGVPADLQKLKPAEPEDAVFVYYAGHGTAAGPRFYLIPHDLGYAGSRTALNEAGLQTILAHSISDVDLEKAFEKVDAGRLLLVIDACNSGQALEAEEKRRGPMNSKGLAQLAYEKGMYILTAAQGYQAALEAAQLGHGFLTYALVEEGLKTAAADRAPKDGQVVSREWLDYATLRVPQIQEAQMQTARKAGRDLAFVDGEQTIQEVAKRSLQRPRVFYRREPETVPLVIAKPEAKP